MLDVLAKLPKAMQAQMKNLVRQVFGRRAARKRSSACAHFRDRYPAAMECLEKASGRA
jgi:hypothetical protein